MSKKKNQRRPWITEEDHALIGYYNRGRTATTALRTAAVRLNRTFYACRARYHSLMKDQVLRDVGPEAEAPKTQIETFDGPIRVKFDSEFNNVSIKDGILHLS